MSVVHGMQNVALTATLSPDALTRRLGSATGREVQGALFDRSEYLAGSLFKNCSNFPICDIKVANCTISPPIEK